MRVDSAFFVCCYLPASVLLYWLIPREKGRNALLLGASLLFCAFGSLSGLLLLLAAAGANYLFGLLLLRDSGGRKAFAAAAIALNVAFLAAFKYLRFLLGAFLPELSWQGIGLAAPLGLSFFVFKCISYVADTCRDPSRGTRSFLDLLLYVSFFPQLTAGPIARFPEFSAQLRGRERRGEDLALGLRRFVLGMGKKLILAGAAARAADPVFADGAALSAPLAWLGALAYLLQIYFDFSGYSDMAIGLGTMFGFSTRENFDHPYLADSVGDFWRRWHISLSSWFRDYLYIPLGGSRKGIGRTALNKFIVFVFCGLWHGAAWTFVLWGAWHGLFSALESLGVIPVRRLRASAPGRVLGHAYALLVVCLGFVLFRADSIAGGWRVLSAMFGAAGGTASAAVLLHRLLTPWNMLLLLLGGLLCLPWKRLLPRTCAAMEEGPLRPLGYGLCLLLLLLCLTELAAGGFAPFIYYQF